MSKELNTGEIVIYKKDNKVELDVQLKEETIWLSQTQMVQLFGKNKRTISEHISNVYKEKELIKSSTVRKFRTVQREKGRIVTRNIEYYNLDVIISVGYRVKSKQGTQFRIWANKVLKDYLIKGYAVNNKIKETQLAELQGSINLLKDVIERKEINQNEALGLLKVITDYTNSWILFNKFDNAELDLKRLNKNILYTISYNDAREAISKLKAELAVKKEASEIFGEERGSLEGILESINQTFDRKDLYPSIEEKAANLLYLIIKNHPFVDGNKRIGSLMFILFLLRNNYLYRENGEKKINDNALVALALLIAESNMKAKEVMVKLTMNLINA